MNLVLVLEHRFRKSADGKIYSSSNSINTALWDRYLKKFDKLIVVARIEKCHLNISQEYYIEHNNVSFFEIPFYKGPIEFLKKRSEIKNILNRLLTPENAFLCRLPSMVGKMLINKLQSKQIPYSVEVVGDPWETFAPNAMKVNFSIVHRIRGYYNLKKLVKSAAGAIYVTKNQLQKRYPVSNNAFTTHASNVMIGKDKIVIEPKIFTKDIKTEIIKLVSVGSLAQLYKSPDIVIEGLAILKHRNYKISFVWMGDGNFKDEMINYAHKLGVSDEIKFIGNVTTDKVHQILAEADMYIHISKTEGLPRSLIEAMAKGLPSIGSTVGGIPELLSPEALIQNIDARSFANKVIEFIENPNLMNQQAALNLEESRFYENSILDARRQQFYNHLLSTSQDFQKININQK
uniref:glycosyltransferase n=1 Tax=Flavobacterium sp. TaxID=239 RepID=UPI004048FCF4